MNYNQLQTMYNAAHNRFIAALVISAICLAILMFVKLIYKLYPDLAIKLNSYIMPVTIICTIFGCILFIGVIIFMVYITITEHSAA